MGTKFFRCLNAKQVLTAIGALALLAFLLGAEPALAQSGVDNSTTTGVFQTEGDAQRTGTICWLPLASGGPAIATPVAAGTNSTDTHGCPTINPAGNSATWSLINYGSSTDDWSSFVFSSGAFTNKAHALFDPAFVTDAVGSQTDNTFLGSSSKDTDDISTWTWNPHGVQDKDDIAHAFASAYHLANGDTAIYAGMDRFANSGDSTAGFWFVQDSTFALCTGFHLAAGPTGNVPNNSCTATGTFVGKHFDGDLLIVSDFSQGGAVSTITIFVWQGGNLVQDATRSPAPCDLVAAGNDLCGLVNNAFTQSVVTKGGKSTLVLTPATVATGGWTFSDKGGVVGAYRTGEFLEIGVDLNKLFTGNLPCFSTFFSETRSSTSPTASLSDLTIPVSFPLCSLSADKTCTTASIVNGNQVQYNFSGHVINTGASTLYTPVVYDTYPVTPVGTPVLNQPSGPITAGNSATFTGSFVSATLLTDQKNRISAAASSNSSGTPLNVVCGTNPPTTDSNECADWGSPCSPLITSGLTITKACKSCLTASNSDVHVTVSEAFKVCNTGNTTVTNLSVQDCRGTISGTPGNQTCSTGFISILSGGSLGAGTAQNPTCTAQLSGGYTPASLPTGDPAGYTDYVIASGSASFVGTVYANNGVPVSATCPVCPIQTDCSTNPPVAP
jgi:hypothetical protein